MVELNQRSKNGMSTFSLETFTFVGEDDGIIEESLSGDTTQYCHIYTPRPLRETTYVLTTNGDVFYGIADLENKMVLK